MTAESSNQKPAPGTPKPNFEDVTLYDVDTGEPFIFTAKEQEFFWKQGFTHVPKHSPERRKLLREQRYKGKPVFNIKCKQCNKVGKVVQEPADIKEIYCQECFTPLWQSYLEKHPDVRALHEQAEQEAEAERQARAAERAQQEAQAQAQAAATPPPRFDEYGNQVS